MNDDDAKTPVAYTTPEELEADTSFLVGQAYGIIKRVREGETGPKINHVMDRFLRDCRAYHRKLYAKEVMDHERQGSDEG